MLAENSLKLKKLNKHINNISKYRKNKDFYFQININKKITKHRNFRISGQKIVPFDSVKYLGLLNANWKHIRGNTFTDGCD